MPARGTRNPRKNLASQGTYAPIAPRSTNPRKVTTTRAGKFCERISAASRPIGAVQCAVLDGFAEVFGG
jgi:hypothetical protein